MLLGYPLTDLLHQWVLCARLGHFLLTYIQSLSFLWTCIKSLLRSKVVGQASSRGVVLLAALWPRLLSTFIKRPEQEPLHSCTTLTCTFAHVLESYISHDECHSLQSNKTGRLSIIRSFDSWIQYNIQLMRAYKPPKCPQRESIMMQPFYHHVSYTIICYVFKAECFRQKV